MMQNNKKILFVTGYFRFAQGGAELQAYYLAQQSLPHFASVAFAYRDHSRQRVEMTDEGFNLLPIKPIKIPLLRRTFFFEGFQLWKILKKFNPSTIYYRGQNAYFCFLAHYARKSDRKLVVHIARDRDVECPHYSSKNFLLLPQYLLTRYGFKHATTIIAQTRYQADLLYKNYGRKAVVIPNSHPIPEDCTNKSDNQITILWIGNWKPIKRPEIFVGLAEKIANRKDIRLIMLGRNALYDVLVEKAKGYGVEVLGEVTNDTVNALLERGHILVNSSIQEGFSNTFIQAWMRRVPVVSLQVDPDGILKQENIGFCSGSFSQLVKDVERLIDDPLLRKTMGEKARKYAIQNHSLDNLQRILDILK